MVVCQLVNGRNETDIYWHPRRKRELRSTVENLNVFNTPEFRDRFELSRTQADDIFKSLNEDHVCEKNQKAYFRCKDFIQHRLQTEMNVEDQAAEFRLRYPPAGEWVPHELVVGSTKSGKTWKICHDRILRNLKGPKKNRRKFKYFSAEWDRDATLAPLKKPKYQDWVEGIDCSDQALKESEWNTPEEFFRNEIQIRVEHAEPHTVIVFDDSMDMCCSSFIKPLLNRMLRTARHDKVSLIILLHCLRSAAWSSTAHQSVCYLTVFPRSQKGKIRDFLNTDIGLTMQESRDLVEDFAQAEPD